jgi:hypothetical protein
MAEMATAIQIDGRCTKAAAANPPTTDAATMITDQTTPPGPPGME